MTMAFFALVRLPCKRAYPPARWDEQRDRALASAVADAQYAAHAIDCTLDAHLPWTKLCARDIQHVVVSIVS
jgi:hypothetical protein